jgi:hypothetical protein
VLSLSFLQVEYMLFECLQDLTGGRTIFLLAARCYIMDVASVDMRTARICFLDATIGLAIIIGNSRIITVLLNKRK